MTCSGQDFRDELLTDFKLRPRMTQDIRLNQHNEYIRNMYVLMIYSIKTCLQYVYHEILVLSLSQLWLLRI